MHLPCSAALPFGAFEAVLQQPENAVAAAAVQKLADAQQPSPGQLKQVRDALLELQASAGLQHELEAAFQQSGRHMLPAVSQHVLCNAKVCMWPNMRQGSFCSVTPDICDKSSFRLPAMRPQHRSYAMMLGDACAV